MSIYVCIYIYICTYVHGGRDRENEGGTELQSIQYRVRSQECECSIVITILMVRILVKILYKYYS